ncbi:ROK family protein [Oceanobacillus arenosus]|uniref:ROK family protein n=1 Tax=Oceanobacillus arenosus TaxID=1229153 RepID=A0A3D8Q285_9BACI|nr:ROK family transcriptional regulator [Oceanobacillus arenosus]RDW22172.1 ROK family protein [Oceanobacillus arenosus]
MSSNKTWNQYVVKQENKALVLRKIIESSPITRPMIANETGLNKGTVSSLVNQLLEEKIIYESGPGESSGGRRPVMLLYNQVAGYSIGIDIGVNYMLGIITDLQGNIHQEKLIKFSNLAFEEIIKRLFGIIDLLLAIAPPSPYGIIGIGIGVPGIVDKNEEILLAPNLGWKNIKLKEILEEKYNLTITIENEANAGAYGEKMFGVGKDFNNIIYVSDGIGIGVGLILNGELYRGNNGFSGELGHMTIEVNGDKCRCGNNGCWELYASEQALLKNANRLEIITAQDDELSLESLVELANAGDIEAIRLFEDLGHYLGVGINNIVNIFNPQQVIIGNRIVAAKKWLNDALFNRSNQTLWFNQKGLQIDFSELSTHSTSLGVSAFSVEKFLDSDIFSL